MESFHSSARNIQLLTWRASVLYRISTCYGTLLAIWYCLDKDCNIGGSFLPHLISTKYLVQRNQFRIRFQEGGWILACYKGLHVLIESCMQPTLETVEWCFTVYSLVLPPACLPGFISTEGYCFLCHWFAEGKLWKPCSVEIQLCRRWESGWCHLPGWWWLEVSQQGSL